MGRFLGVSDLFTSVHALQLALDAQTHEVDALRRRADASDAKIPELSKRLDALVKGESDLRLGLAVWVTATYLTYLPVPEGALISVVLATRNRADLVPRAIESVIAQSYGNWELIAVDDGSDDHTPETLNAYTDSRIRVVHREQRGGLSAARNAGLDEARGEYVVYLDDDNVLHPQWLRGVAWAFELHPKSELMVGARIIDDEQRNRGFEAGGWPQLALPWFDPARIRQENVADVLQIAHRRDLPGARFDEQLSSAEDWDLLARLTRDRDPLVFPALAGIYTTSASDRLMEDDLMAREERRVREKIAAERADL
jgi:Glycosyl transferase family 2